MSGYACYSDSYGKLQDNKNEVGILVSKYSKVGTPHPVLCELLKQPEVCPLLWDVIEHQLSLIRSRSQALEDNQVTIYDKVLLSLSSNGGDMSNLGALNFYLDKFVGVTRDGTCQDTRTVLDKHAALKSSLMKRM
jgi:hypothetical protein